MLRPSMQRPSSSRRLGLTFLVLTAMSLGCATYTAYLQFDPESDSRRKLSERERERAVRTVEEVVYEMGFIANPRLIQAQRKALNSVESPFNLITSYVPPRAMTGHRLSVSTITYKANGRFAVLVRDPDAGAPTDLVLEVQDKLSDALYEEFPDCAVELEHSRWAPDVLR